METKIKKIAIVDPSWLVIEGLKELIAIYKEFRVVWSGQELTGLSEKMGNGELDIIIINPMIIDYSKRASIRSAFGINVEIAMIALLYNYFESDVLKQFDEIIEIAENKHRMIKKIRHVNPVDLENSVENYELSDREKEILIAVAKGMTNKEIADCHHISIHTVISHRKNITRKTGIKSISGLTVYALLNNLIDQNDIE